MEGWWQSTWLASSARNSDFLNSLVGNIDDESWDWILQRTDIQLCSAACATLLVIFLTCYFLFRKVTVRNIEPHGRIWRFRPARFSVTLSARVKSVPTHSAFIFFFDDDRHTIIDVPVQWIVEPEESSFKKFDIVIPAHELVAHGYEALDQLRVSCVYDKRAKKIGDSVPIKVAKKLHKYEWALLPKLKEGVDLSFDGPFRTQMETLLQKYRDGTASPAEVHVGEVLNQYVENNEVPLLDRHVGASFTYDPAALTSDCCRLLLLPAGFDGRNKDADPSISEAIDLVEQATNNCKHSFSTSKNVLNTLTQLVAQRSSDPDSVDLIAHNLRDSHKHSPSSVDATNTATNDGDTTSTEQQKDDDSDVKDPQAAKEGGSGDNDNRHHAVFDLVDCLFARKANKLLRKARSARLRLCLLVSAPRAEMAGGTKGGQETVQQRREPVAVFFGRETYRVHIPNPILLPDRSGASALGNAPTVSDESAVVGTDLRYVIVRSIFEHDQNMFVGIGRPEKTPHWHVDFRDGRDSIVHTNVLPAKKVPTVPGPYAISICYDDFQFGGRAIELTPLPFATVTREISSKSGTEYVHTLQAKCVQQLETTIVVHQHGLPRNRLDHAAMGLFLLHQDMENQPTFSEHLAGSIGHHLCDSGFQTAQKSLLDTLASSEKDSDYRTGDGGLSVQTENGSKIRVDLIDFVRLESANKIGQPSQLDDHFTTSHRVVFSSDSVRPGWHFCVPLLTSDPNTNFRQQTMTKENQDRVLRTISQLRINGSLQTTGGPQLIYVQPPIIDVVLSQNGPNWNQAIKIEGCSRSVAGKLMLQHYLRPHLDYERIAQHTLTDYGTTNSSVTLDQEFNTPINQGDFTLFYAHKKTTAHLPDQVLASKTVTVGFRSSTSILGDALQFAPDDDIEDVGSYTGEYDEVTSTGVKTPGTGENGRWMCWCKSVVPFLPSLAEEAAGPLHKTSLELKFGNLQPGKYRFVFMWSSKARTSTTSTDIVPLSVSPEFEIFGPRLVIAKKDGVSIRGAVVHFRNKLSVKLDPGMSVGSSQTVGFRCEKQQYMMDNQLAPIVDFIAPATAVSSGHQLAGALFVCIRLSQLPKPDDFVALIARNAAGDVSNHLEQTKVLVNATGGNAAVHGANVVVRLPVDSYVQEGVEYLVGYFTTEVTEEEVKGYFSTTTKKVSTIVLSAISRQYATVDGSRGRVTFPSSIRGDDCFPPLRPDFFPTCPLLRNIIPLNQTAGILAPRPVSVQDQEVLGRVLFDKLFDC